MMLTQSFPRSTTMPGMKKGVKTMKGKKGGYDGGTSGPPMRKACESGTKGMPAKGKPVKTGNPSRTMH